jgi:hypothetical protein
LAVDFLTFCLGKVSGGKLEIGDFNQGFRDFLGISMIEFQSANIAGRTGFQPVLVGFVVVGQCNACSSNKVSLFKGFEGCF